MKNTSKYLIEVFWFIFVPYPVGGWLSSGNLHSAGYKLEKLKPKNA